jgi:hypothetical protein
LRSLRSAFSLPAVPAALLAGVAGASFGEARHRGYLAASASWLAFLVVGGVEPAGITVQLQVAPALALACVAAGGIGRVAVRTAVAVAVVALGVELAGIPLLLGTLAEEELPLREQQHDVIKWLTPLPASYVATAEAGALGYYLPGIDFVDFKGGVGPRDLDYMFMVRAPQLLIVRLRLAPLRDPSGQLLIPPALAASREERRMLEDPRFTQHYKLYLVATRDGEHGFARAVYRNVVFDEGLLPRRVSDLVDLPRAQ